MEAVQIASYPSRSKSITFSQIQELGDHWARRGPAWAKGIRVVDIKMEHLGEYGGFGTADADSGASCGDQGIEAPGGGLKMHDRLRLAALERQGMP